MIDYMIGAAVGLLVGFVWGKWHRELIKVWKQLKKDFEKVDKK